MPKLLAPRRFRTGAGTQFPSTSPLTHAPHALAEAVYALLTRCPNRSQHEPVWSRCDAVSCLYCASLHVSDLSEATRLVSPDLMLTVHCDDVVVATKQFSRLRSKLTRRGYTFEHCFAFEVGPVAG